MSQTQDEHVEVGRPIWRRGGVWIGAGAAGLLVALLAWAPGVSASLRRAALGQGRGHAALLLEDPARAAERAAFAAECVLRTVNGSPEQQERAQQLARRLVADLVPLAERHRTNREALAAELAKPNLDRQALERIREAELALVDEASRLGVAALADFGEILRPEQRAELLQLVHRAHGLRSGH